MQLIVLGMHRSGTSGVTRLLNLAGAWFGEPEDATEANEENPRGFWERRDVRAVCDGLLHDAGHDWWRLADFDVEDLPPESVEQRRAEMAEVVDRLAPHAPWVIKEPRLCLLLPALMPVLDDPVCIHVVREPLEVAHSLRARNGFPVTAGLALWELHTVRSLEASADLRRVLVRHEDVLADPIGTTATLIEQLTALGVVGLGPVPDDEITDFIDPGLHRQRQDAASRGAWLNATQAQLAAAIDAGTVLDTGPPAPVSEASLDALEGLEATYQVEEGLREEARVARADAAEQTRAREAAERATAAEVRKREQAERDTAVEVKKREAAQRRTANEAREREKQNRYREVELARRREIGRLAENAFATLDSQLVGIGASRVGRVASGLLAVRRALPPGPRRPPVSIVHQPRLDLAERRREIAARTRQDPAPGGASDTTFATEDPLIRRTRLARPRSGDRPSVAVIAWDVGHNPLGRANVLAEVLARRFDVELWGAQFPRYGERVWAPMREIATPVNVFTGSTFPQHMETMEAVARRIDADAVWVSKPRLPSFALGILAKQARNRPLVVDVDDHELAFFAEDEGLTLDEAINTDRDALEWPFERAWTRACDPLIGEADAVTVSNPALQQRYGGEIVPHARDENVFDPDKVDRWAVRHELDIPDDERLLLFGGTPRVHKGVVEILQALEKIGDERYRVLVFGTKELDELRESIGELTRWARVLPPQPFARLPGLVAAADLACVIQDATHPVARYQMPAKVSDALAMGVPLLVAPTPPMAALAAEGAVDVVEPGQALHEAISRTFDDPDAASERARAGRELFLRDLSYAAVEERVGPLFEELLADVPPASPALRALVEAPGRAFSDDPAARQATPDPAPAKPDRTVPVRKPRHLDDDAPDIDPGAVVDVVMFWKQNDSGIYGRRQDMFLQELARSERIGTIVHFDGPITPEALVAAYREGRGEASDQRRLVVGQTIGRVLRRRDEPGVHRHTFVYGGHWSRRLGRPPRRAYADHARAVLDRHGFGDRPIVLWAYPTNDDLPGLIDAVAPEIVVADVVDDNRTWYETGSPHIERIEKNYREVLSRSDVVLANCEPVAESMREFVDDVHVVPNGCELPSDGPRPPRPAELPPPRGPVIAYVGNLSSRIDLDLLEGIARARPQWDLVLVGSAHLDRSALALGRLPNVHLPGVVPYDRVKDMLAHVDVGLIPHVDDAMTRSMNPLKAYVYAAAGVPVVSTPVANLAEIGGSLTVAEGVDGFVSAIEDHLARGRPEVDVDSLVPHSWGERVARVLELVDRALAD